jgi:hypothetical protein
VWDALGRNDPNNVCTYEFMNKEKKHEKKKTRLVCTKETKKYAFNKAHP